MLQRVPPCSRLKLSDKEKATSRHGGRRTCSIRRTLIPSPILLHTPTMRTLHIAQILRESYKTSNQFVSEPSAAAAAVRARFRFFFLFALPELRGREYRENIRLKMRAFGKVKRKNAHRSLLRHYTKAISMCVMCVKLGTSVLQTFVAGFTKSACHN